VHEILSQSASVENRGYESDMSLVVGAVLGDYIRGVNGGVGYWGSLAAIGNVLHNWAGTGNRDREQVCCLSVVPLSGLGFETVHLWHGGWPRGHLSGQWSHTRRQLCKEYLANGVTVEGRGWGQELVGVGQCESCHGSGRCLTGWGPGWKHIMVNFDAFEQLCLEHMCAKGLAGCAGFWDG